MANTRSGARSTALDELFRKKPPFYKNKSKVDAWFDAHPECLAQVDHWLKLRANRESPWGLKSMWIYLRQEFAFPFATKTTLLAWLEANRPTEYAAGLREE